MKDTVAKQKVLVVDDESTNIDILAEVLGEDYQVNAAVSGEQALEIARSSDRPDIILLDIMMPQMDGYEVCRRLKQERTTCRIPVIFITAKIQIEDEMRGLELGAVDYITKPFSPPIVGARVKTHLALSSQTRELDRKVRERTRELNDTRLQIVHLLGRAAEYKDEDAGLHVIRVGNYSYLLAIAAGMDEADANLLLNAAPLHDIGKIGVPDSILQKTGKLDAHEWKLMKKHCEIGARIIGENTGSKLLDLASVVTMNHHEKWDGSGYPKGLKGKEIPLAGRIAALADVFDVLTTTLPYRRSWSLEEAIELVKNEAGHHFDPDLVRHFFDILPDILKVKDQYSDIVVVEE